MSHPDATTALKIYKTFCRDTEKVVAYLGVAKVRPPRTARSRKVSVRSDADGAL